MSIDERLRRGLPDLVDGGPVDVELALAGLLDRATRRRRWQLGAYAVGLAAAVAGIVVWVSGPDPAARTVEPATPGDGDVQVLSAERGTPEHPAALEPGSYAIAVNGAAVPDGRLSVPAGWSQDRLALTTGRDLDPHLRRVELLGVGLVSPDPCRSPEMQQVDGTVDSLLSTLESQESTNPRQRTPVFLDGYPGARISFEVPARLGDTGCHVGQASMVPLATPAGAEYTVFRGWSYDLWIVDVHGEALVIATSYGPDVTFEERAEVEEMVLDLDLASADLLPDPGRD